MHRVIQDLEQKQLRRGRPRFKPGDTVRVHFQVIEGSRRRTQVFEGIVLKRQGSGVRETFTVRKQSFGVGVERTFPLHSPKIEKLEVAARGDVRRAKLYYLRGRIGKAARVAERRWGIDDDVVSVAGAADGESTAVDAEGVSQEEVVPVAAPVEAPEDAEEEAPAAEAESEATEEAQEAETPAEPEAAAESETETVAEADAEASEAGETEDTSAPEDAEDEEPSADGDSDEDSAA